MHFLARCSYDGADYCGFAKSPPFTTVQETIEQTLIRLFGANSPYNQSIAGGSRTDKGVHALDQCFTFHAPHQIATDKLTSILNQHLPGSIRINSISSIDDEYNLHQQIYSKTYLYMIYHAQTMSPFLARYVWHETRCFPENQWSALFELLQGKKDFRFFAKEAHRYGSTICNLEQAKAWLIPKIPATVLSFKGNRFLYNMVRRIIGFSHMMLLKKAPLPSTYQDLISQYSSWTILRAPSNGLYLYQTQTK